MTAIDTIRANLEARLAALGVEIARLEAESSQPLEADWEEQANQIEDMEASQGLEAVRMDEVNQIRAALRRMESGTYGTCASCGADIAPARLAALPTATLCINCAP
ncbi:MAG: TraR/DksA family transcriptional regulator [Sandaracinobacter sp.]|jgi:RNA polymerase-binding transcription factor DksA